MPSYRGAFFKLDSPIDAPELVMRCVLGNQVRRVPGAFTKPMDRGSKDFLWLKINTARADRLHLQFERRLP